MIYVVISLAVIPLPYRIQYEIVTSWCTLEMLVLRLIFGIRFRVIGRENLGSEAKVVVSNHQSALETVMFTRLFPNQTWVLKKVILWLPLFGWAIGTLKPIAINRNNKRQAMKEILTQGKNRLANGIWVVMFPEGTRVQPGEYKKFQKGASVLAHSAKAPLLPVAVSTAEVWPKNSIKKYAGEALISIGKPITEGTATEMNNQAERWIREELSRLQAIQNKET